MTITKLLIALAAMCMALYNAVTAGTRRWSIATYWAIVSFYWLIGCWVIT